MKRWIQFGVDGVPLAAIRSRASLEAEEQTVKRRAERRSKALAPAIQARIDYYGGRCYMCGAPAQAIDHVIPLARGGSNLPANLRPACNSCNSRKGAR